MAQLTPEEKKASMLRARAKAPRSPAKGKTWSKGPIVTKKRFKKALRGTGGVLLHVAQRLGVRWASLQQRLQHPEWKDMLVLLEQEKLTVGQEAEKAILRIIKLKDEPAVALKASTWYQERTNPTYKPKKEVTIEGGENPLKVNTNFIPLEQLSLQQRRDILSQLEPTTVEDSTPPKPRVKVRRIVP
jgi:hypothetical protein